MNHIKPKKKKIKWSSNFIDIYRENLTNLKNDIEDGIHRAEIKGSPLEDDINEIANAISEALKKAAYNSGMGKSTQKTNVKKNEFLKHSRNEFVQYYTKLFNLILESRHMPAD